MRPPLNVPHRLNDVLVTLVTPLLASDVIHQFHKSLRLAKPITLVPARASRVCCVYNSKVTSPIFEKERKCRYDCSVEDTYLNSRNSLLPLRFCYHFNEITSSSFAPTRPIFSRVHFSSKFLVCLRRGGFRVGYRFSVSE